MSNPLVRLKHHVSGAIRRGEKQAIIEQPPAPEHKPMNSYDAIAILDGFYDGEVTAELWLEASRFIRDHGPRGVLAGSGTRNAIELADYADAHGDDAALDMIWGWAMQTFYHGTAASKLPSILKSGLLPHGSAGADQWVKRVRPAMGEKMAQAAKLPDRKNAVFITQDIVVAAAFATATANLNKSQPVVLEVKLPADAYHTLREDAKSLDPFGNNEMEAYEYQGKIPPDWLEPVPVEAINWDDVDPFYRTRV